MADLLLELFSEEIPARMQAEALEHLRGQLVRSLMKEGVISDTAWTPKGFVTPRRLAVWASDLPVEQAASETELKGPKVGAPEAALQGFLKKSGLAQSDLTEREGVYFAVVKKEGKQTAEILKALIEAILLSFPWPKSMRWGAGDQAWVRPLHSMICIFDGKVIPVTFASVTASNITRGHRFLSSDILTINDPSAYEAALEKAFVVADREKRKAEIFKQAERIAAEQNLVLKKDESLLEEVTGLVEYPVLLVGSIDAKFMDLPKEVLVSEMRAHQKYFALVIPSEAEGSSSITQDPSTALRSAQDDKLAPYFLITSNMKSSDGGKAIIAGNERVLRARLSDGRFFWDQDRKKPLSEWAEGLKSVTFHAKLGTIADKVARIKTLAVQLAAHVPAADTKLVERAALLCKADLVTGMVGEFPELQGVMGRYYAVAQKEDAAVADAIRDHYKPQGPGDSVPSNPVAICVALADKLDTLVSMFAIGEKPTGSKDPFALRRAALGVIRIILDNKIRLPLKAIFAVPPAANIALHMAQEKLVKQTEASLQHPHRVGKYVVVDESACEELTSAVPQNLTAMLYDFFIDRLKVQLKDFGIRHDVISAVVADGDDDLVRIVNRAKAVQEFLGTDDGVNLLAGYKRAANILAIEERKDQTTYHQEVTSANLKDSDEKTLCDTLDTIDRQAMGLVESENFTKAMKILAELRGPVDRFFEKTMVNCEDKELRANRLRLLSFMRDTINSIANFSLIEG